MDQKYSLSLKHIEEYQISLMERECSKNTISKYMRDIRTFYEYLPENKEISKACVVEYKAYLSTNYKGTSANSMLAALNCFFHFKGWDDCRVGLFKVQRQLMGSEDRKLTKEEYKRLIKAAWSSENKRLAMIMETIGNTGIRISELPFITVEALDTGRVEIYNKGKFRTIFMIEKLRCRLRAYCRDNGLTSGPVFVTSGGMSVNRSNIWAEMKRLCIKAGIPEQKVYPHNLRHLFAYTYYGVDKDLVHLADILGHSSVETTRIYTISTGEEQQEVMQKMEMII